MVKLTFNKEEIAQNREGARLELADMQPFEDWLLDDERSDEEIETRQRVVAQLEHMARKGTPRTTEMTLEQLFGPSST